MLLQTKQQTDDAHIHTHNNRALFLMPENHPALVLILQQYPHPEKFNADAQPVYEVNNLVRMSCKLLIKLLVFLDQYKNFC